MAMESGGTLISDVRKLLQDIVTPDLKALAVRVEGLGKQLDGVKQDVQALRGELLSTRDRLEADIQKLNDRQERRFDRLESALDVYKKVQELEEFRIRTEGRQKASA